MELKEKLRKLLLKNDFNGLEELLSGMDVETWGGKLLDIAYDNGSLVSYILICMMLIKKESPKLHCFASILLSQSLSHIEDAYASGYYHIQRAVMLDPENVDYKEALLFFHEIPDQLVSKEEALRVAKEILQKKPDSSAALEIVERCG